MMESVVAETVEPLGAVLLVLGLTDDLLTMDLPRRVLECRAGDIRPPCRNRISTITGNLARLTGLFARLGQRNQ
jgi:hypothetical protein